jgi:hypothetical protein
MFPFREEVLRRPIESTPESDHFIAKQRNDALCQEETSHLGLAENYPDDASFRLHHVEG